MKTTKRLLLAVLLAATCFSAKAQQVNTLYFIDNTPTRHYINPALEPISNFYLSLPVIGYTSFWGGNNSLTVGDVVVSKNQKLYWFLAPEVGGTEAFLKKMRNSTLVDLDAQINLLSFGFRIKENGYFHLTINEKMEGGVSMPKGLFQFAVGGGMTNLTGTNTFDLKQLGMNMSLYSEVGIGYSHQIGEHWAIGVKAKALLGQANLAMTNTKFDFNTSLDEWNFNGEGQMQMAMPAAFPQPKAAEYEAMKDWISDIQNIDFNKDFILSMLKPAGYGAAFDLGITYKPIKQIQLSLGVTDLGFIRWKSGTKYKYSIDATFDGIHDLTYKDFEDNTDALIDTVTTRLTNLYKEALHNNGFENNGYTRMISAKLNAGLDFNFWENRVGFGVLSRTRFVNRQVYEEVTIGAAFRPCHWFQIAGSYSILNGHSSNIGAALGFVTYEGLGLTLGLDYIPLSYVKTDSQNKWGIPYQTKGVNLALGLNLVIGHRRDKDKDGVKDRYDLCPKTPRGVEVDKNGCPVDTDGDGVPDYLDDCPNTPEAAYESVNEYGCPIDTDGDGVPDYLDQCPNTPEAAYGTVDEHGCPKDTDGDGVPDYLDKCPNTPAAAKGMVDANGCPLDTDGDGVPDYMDDCPNTPRGTEVTSRGCTRDSDGDGVPDDIDECPNTPKEAYGTVDEHGCPKDSDGDGVPDYIDRCPDTPRDAAYQVDRYGCPPSKDSDGDGVPDYMDECPNTPAAAYGTVNEHGCPIDSDNDGIPDYLDKCPTTPGVESNHGCPEIQREVRDLIQQAMQGIQFQTGKSVILESSFPILNNIAVAFLQNPNWLIEVQGHTDNVGKPAANQKLSEDRANAVRDYLINAGVPEERLTAVGYGDTAPIASNQTAQGRAQNRRVEFVISFEEVTYETVKLDEDGNEIEEEEEVVEEPVVRPVVEEAVEEVVEVVEEVVEQVEEVKPNSTNIKPTTKPTDNDNEEDNSNNSSKYNIKPTAL